MIRLYRACRNVYDPKDPTGAIRTPGRWHILGQSVLYFSSSLALCVLEFKANSVSFAAIRNEYHYIDIEINTEHFVIEEPAKLFYSKNWILKRELTQEYGSEWFYRSKSPILKVKSAVLPTDFNFILNTTHPMFSNLKFSTTMDVPLDPRV